MQYHLLGIFERLPKVANLSNSIVCNMMQGLSRLATLAELMLQLLNYFCTCSSLKKILLQ